MSAGRAVLKGVGDAFRPVYTTVELIGGHVTMASKAMSANCELLFFVACWYLEY